jgi:hypothetical protein
MKSISTRVVQDVHREFRDVKKPELRDKAEELNENQPELLAFLQASIGELDQQAADLTVYLAFMIARMYEQAYNGDMPEVSPEDIIESYRGNEEKLQNMDEASPAEGSAATPETDQPNVMRYVTRVLSDAGKTEDEGGLTNEQQGASYLTLKTIVDALDKRLKS